MDNNFSQRLQQHSLEFLSSRHSLMAMIVGLTRNPHVAEDIFQEVWIKLAEAVERGVEIRDTPKWCRGVAKNLILHYWRDARNSKVIISEKFIELAETAFNEQDDDQELWGQRRQALEQCVRDLPDHSREILKLKYDQDRDMAAVAQLLQKSVASVKMTLCRLRQLLSDCVTKKLSAEETP